MLYDYNSMNSSCMRLQVIFARKWSTTHVTKKFFLEFRALFELLFRLLFAFTITDTVIWTSRVVACFCSRTTVLRYIWTICKMKTLVNRFVRIDRYVWEVIFIMSVSYSYDRNTLNEIFLEYFSLVLRLVFFFDLLSKDP